MGQESCSYLIPHLPCCDCPKTRHTRRATLHLGSVCLHSCMFPPREADIMICITLQAWSFLFVRYPFLYTTDVPF